MTPSSIQPSPPLPRSSSAPDLGAASSSPSSSSSSQRRNSKKTERMARTISNLMIIIGALVCLGLGVVAVYEGNFHDATFLVVLVPAFFVCGCVLILVNLSWVYRRPGSRCSFVQFTVNMVFLVMTTYVELVFWPERSGLALAILLAVALPMFIFINIPSAFMQEEEQFFGAREEDDISTVVMGDDEHSLFTVDPEVQSTTTALDNCGRPDSEDMPDLEQQGNRNGDS